MPVTATTDFISVISHWLNGGGWMTCFLAFFLVLFHLRNWNMIKKLYVLCAVCVLWNWCKRWRALFPNGEFPIKTGSKLCPLEDHRFLQRFDWLPMRGLRRTQLRVVFGKFREIHKEIMMPAKLSVLNPDWYSLQVFSMLECFQGYLANSSGVKELVIITSSNTSHFFQTLDWFHSIFFRWIFKLDLVRRNWKQDCFKLMQNIQICWLAFTWQIQVRWKKISINTSCNTSHFFQTLDWFHSILFYCHHYYHGLKCGSVMNIQVRLCVRRNC